MATSKTITQMTIKELTARMDPKGNPARIAEVLQQKNAILNDIPWFEANETFSNRTVRRSAEPTGSFRKINLGVAATASKTTPIVDVVGLLESYSEVDERLASAAPSPVQFRSGEDMAHVAGMGKTIAGKLISGNANTTPEEFTGFNARMDNIATNVVDAGGSGSDLTSIYVVTWGMDYCHGIYGRGMQGGLKQDDLGLQLIKDSNGLNNTWWITHFIWEAGLVVRNERGMGRIANIESSKTATVNAFDEDDLIDLMVEMDLVNGQSVIYMNRNMYAQSWKRLKDKNNVYFTRNDGLDAGGMPLSFNGIPMRLVEQITNTQTAIT